MDECGLITKRFNVMKCFIISIPFLFMLVSCNPFAPAWDDSSGETSSFWADQKSLNGMFQNLEYVYTTSRDTSDYGKLFDNDFTFLYPDYDRGGAEISWGRDEEMRTTDGLFKSVLRMNLLWNNIIDSSSIDSYTTEASISRGFNLTVTFSASDIISIDGYASLRFKRQGTDYPWMIVRWHDDSNH